MLPIKGEAAWRKGITHPTASSANVLIVPDLEAANVLKKPWNTSQRVRKAGIIMGAITLAVLTSRASSNQSKLNSIALAVIAADYQQLI